MISREVTVVNEYGLHARPASKIAQLASQFEASVELKNQSHGVNAKSLLGILTLAAAKNTVLTISADGPDEQDAIEALANLFAQGFTE